MRFGSLFSGIGGFDLGFERAGMACVWQVEIDKDCQRVLRKQFANAERYEDVSTVGKLPTVDVICGGFPCQDLSVAGKRAGLAGERSGLWFQFLRIIESNLPRWIVVENVPGLLSSDEGRDFAAILRGLVECGYCLAWRIFDAQYDGVAQRRRRVFIVGSLGDGSCAEILFESESVSWNPPTRGEAGAGVANSISGGAHPGGHNGQDDMSVIAMPLKSKANSSHDESHETYIPGYIHPRQMRGSESSNQVGIKPDADVTDSLTQEGPGAVMVPQVTHALRSEGTDASEDGTGRGTPLIATPITSSFARHHGRTAGNNGGADNLVVTDLEHDRFHCLTCGQWFCVNDYESNTVTCPKCGETHIDKITDVLDARAVDVRNLRMQPDGTSGTLQHKKSGGYSLNYQNPVMAFDERNITSRENRSNPKPGDPCHTLHADPPTLVAFSSKDHGADAGEISPTLRAQNSKDSHQNGGGQVAIAFGWNKSDSQTMRVDEETTDALQSAPCSQPAIAFTERTRSEGRALEAQEELAYAVTNPGSGGRTHSRQIAGGFGVRRLTPRECERLQGFPDDWTLYDSEGKEISDSARYRMLGNAVAVPVAKWIGTRIVEIAKGLKD